MKRQVFKLKPDWDAIRNSVVEATCKLQAPNMNEAGVPIRFGSTACHESCASCMRGGEGATDCTMCKPDAPHHTILNPRFGTGTCTLRLCPLCKPKECCGNGHRHLILDAQSMNGMCLKHTDDCKAHCVAYDIHMPNSLTALGTVCTKGCNDVMKVLGNKVGKKQLFDVVVCQAEKTVKCTPAKHPGMEEDHDSIVDAGVPLKSCSSSKWVTPEAVCTDLDEDATSEVWAAGGSCILDILQKLKCDRDVSTGECLKTAAGAFMGCTVMDLAPFACGPHVLEYSRQSLVCSCSAITRQRDSCPGQNHAASIGHFEPTALHTGACEDLAGTF